MTRGGSRKDDDPAALLEQSRAVRLRDQRLAARCAIRAIRAARARSDPDCELKAYWALSAAAALARRWASVIAIIDCALACESARTDEVLRARTLLGRGSALIHLGRIDDVRRDAEASLPVLLRAANTKGVASAHGLLATAAAEVGNHREVIEHVGPWRAALGDRAAPSELGAVEMCEGTARIGLFEFAEALRLFESASARFEAVGAEVEAAYARYNCAYLHLRSGRYAEAMRLHARVEEVFEREENDVLLGALSVDRAELLLEIGATAEAQRGARRVLELRAGAVSVKDALRTRQMLAVAALHDGKPETAFEAAAAVADDFTGFADLRGAAESLVVLSSAALALGDADEAAQIAEDAAGLFDEAATGASACAADFAGCSAALALGDVPAAEALLGRAAARDGFSALPWIGVEWSRHRAMVLAALGRVPEAAALLPPDALRSAFFARHAPLYRDAVDAHALAGLDVRAFELAAAAKSRSLLDLMAGGAVLGAADTPRLDRLRTDLSAAYARLEALSHRRAPPREFVAARAEASRLERETADVVAKALNRESGDAAGAPPLRAADLQAALAEGSVLVEYAAGRDGLHAFVVTREAVRRVALGVTPSEVDEIVRRVDLQMAFANVPGTGAPGGETADLVRAHLADLRALLTDPLALPPGVRHVVIAPDPTLQGVPFQAFPAERGPGWWADDVLVSYAPSAIVHAVCVRAGAPAPGPAHVLAVPDEAAPEVRTEAAQVARALGPDTVVRCGDEATWAQFVAAAASAGLLHVATHGLSRTGTVVGGSIRLADCWLTPFDLYRLRVHADLVVLSACDSGATHVEGSGDPFGLVRGFLCAGARRLVTSRWRVDDRTTTEWMEAFYGGLAGGRTVGDAYLAACRTIRAGRPHPFHWAPFVLLGDPDRPVTGTAVPERRPG